MAAIPQTVWLKQHKFIVSQFWSLNVWDEDVGRARLPVKALGKDLFQDSLLESLPCNSLTPIFTLDFFYGCMSVVKFPIL